MADSDQGTIGIEVVGMASNRPVMYLDLLKTFAEKGHYRKTEVLPFRTNTRVEVKGYDPLMFDIILYDTRVATLYHDGSVRVFGTGSALTNTTKNRINDALIPLGWRVKSVGGRWMVHSWLTGTTLEFIDGMKIDPAEGSEVWKRHRKFDQ